MIEPRQLIVVTDTPALIAVIRKQADALGLSRKDINALAELADGHCEKLLSIVPSKGMGLGIVWGLVEAVGLKIAIVESPEAMVRIAEFVGMRNESQVRKPSVRSVLRTKKKARLQRIFNDPKYFNKLGKKGGRARTKSLTPQERSKAAIHANRVRWRAVRERRRQTRNAPGQTQETIAAQ